MNNFGLPIRYLIYISYNGNYFYGFQRQVFKKQNDLLRSVFGIFKSALTLLNPECHIQIRGSSRTDTGVHALNSSLHFDLQHPNADKIFTPTYIKYRLNQIFVRCKEHVRVNSVRIVPSTFDARKNAIYKTYVYKIAVPKYPNDQLINKKKVDRSRDNKHLYYQQRININSKEEEIYHERLSCFAIPLWAQNLIHFFPYPDFCRQKVGEAIKLFVGDHDFATFMSPCSKKSSQTHKYLLTKRTISSAEFYPLGKNINDQDTKFNFIDHFFNLSEFDYYQFTFESRGFLYHQVRKMVGALLSLGIGKISIEDIRYMLDNPDIENWNPRILMAPANGLYLADVKYDLKDLTNFTSDYPLFKYDETGTIIDS
ncbi:tRNA pseudouridine synthase A-like [Gordionus sp. m RMFG-2023]|uniref:tRNA pseudouridine synthase A-like n=1 Tax=Gordionus sp. m RMFG-2023 TaxID=3053472 RepID=UPI0031FC1919